VLAYKSDPTPQQEAILQRFFTVYGRCFAWLAFPERSALNC